MVPSMPLAQTRHGALHYETLDHTVAWQSPGLPVLFHHGIGSSAALWRGWTPALIDRYPLASFDMRGCGRSHIPGAGFEWSLDRMVEDLFAVADAAVIAVFLLVG
jgi:pimeloyl-ACP methyl ester carboxylesterase